MATVTPKAYGFRRAAPESGGHALSRRSLVRLEEVTLRFEGTCVLNRLHLNVAPTERLVVMGPSGTGKSTLLRLLVGTLTPDRGAVYIKDRDITRLKTRKLNEIRMHIGMVFQYSALLSSRTVRENLALPLQELTRKSEPEIEKIIDEKLEFVGLPERKIEVVPSVIRCRRVCEEITRE